MEPPTSRCNNLGGVPAWTWVPLKHRETVLMMHEIAVNSINVTEPIGFGLPKFDHRKNKGSWFREKDLFLHEDPHQQDCGFPQGRCWHSFFWDAVERVGCGPNWVVLTWRSTARGC